MLVPVSSYRYLASFFGKCKKVHEKVNPPLSLQKTPTFTLVLFLKVKALTQPSSEYCETDGFSFALNKSKNIRLDFSGIKVE